MVKATDILLRALVTLLIAAGLASCSSDDTGGDIPDVTRPAQVSFRFTIHTDGSHRSRALGVWEEDADGIPERILDADDMRILIFDQSGSLLKTVRPSSLEYQDAAYGNDGYYTLSASFTHEYFDKFDDSSYVPFQIMILANLESIGGQYTTYSPGTRATAITDAFTMPAAYRPTADGGIPMYGIQHLYIPKSLLSQGPDAPVAADIDLIRALCRIDVSDRIVNAAGTGDNRYPRVLSVEMTSWNDNGYIRPLYDDYAAGLREANIHPGDPADTPVTADSRPDGLFRFYCPEADIADMAFRVTAILAPGQPPRTYDVSLTGFGPALGTQMVRNHIYRFNVHALNTAALLDVSVSDWTTVRDEFELDNIVSMEPDGFMRWTYDDDDFAVTTETFNGHPEQQLSILNGSTGYATARFHIISPRGASWKAYFIPGENGVDAFEFVDTDADGNVIPGSARVFAEGSVGTPAVIHVRGKGPADAYRHWAELVVEVSTADGTVLYAPLTEALSSRFIIYRENRL